MANKESDSHKGLERRKFERFTCTVDISSEISYGRSSEYLGAEKSGYLVVPGSERQKAKLVNLSLSGAKLLAKNPMSVGTCLTIRLGGSPNISLIEAKARVVWCKSVRSEFDAYHVGVVFHGLGWRQRFRLKRLIKRLSRESS